MGIWRPRAARAFRLVSNIWPPTKPNTTSTPRPLVAWRVSSEISTLQVNPMVNWQKTGGRNTRFVSHGTDYPRSYGMRDASSGTSYRTGRPKDKDVLTRLDLCSVHESGPSCQVGNADAGS